MKTLLFILCFITAYTCGAQGNWDDTLIGKPIWKVKPLPMDGNDIVYTGQVTLAGYSQDQLFKNALDWHNNNYKSSDTRLTVENKERGTIAGNGIIHYEQQVVANGPQNIFFTFSITLKSAGYAYRFYDTYSMVNGQKFNYSDMYSEERHTTAAVKPRWTHQYRYESLMDMDAFINLAINQLKKDMEKK